MFDTVDVALMKPRIKNMIMKMRNRKGRPKSSKKLTIFVTLLFFHTTFSSFIGTGISWSCTLRNLIRE